MEPQANQIREQQKQSWNKFSPGWKKWDTFNMNFLRPMGDAIIEGLQLKGNEHVLDIATGTGEPGLSIAQLLPTGKVIGTDLAEDMLAIAQENALTKGIKNYETITTDACELLFNDERFDAVSCRMGFMFFPNMKVAAQQMYRVLKPKGRLSVSVWGGPEENNWVTTIMGVIQKHLALPPPPPGAPGMFRCAAPGVMYQLFKDAGFKNIVEKQISNTVDYESFDRYWELMMDVGAPIVAAMASADEETKALIKKETAELFKSKNKTREAKLEYTAIVITAEKYPISPLFPEY